VLVAVVAALFGATGRSSTYFLALIVPVTLGVSASEALYTVLLPAFTRPDRPPRALLHASLRVSAPLLLGANALYVAVVLGVSPGRLSVWLAFSPLVAAIGLNGVYAAFLTAERRYPLAILRVPLGTAVALAAAAAILPFWETPTAIAIAVSAGQIATLALLALSTRNAPRGNGGDAVSARTLVPGAAAVFAATLVGSQLVMVVERFLATGLAASAVALLAFARGIALLPIMLAQAVGSGIFPAATERFKALERTSLSQLAQSAMRLSVLAGLVSTAYVAICRRELVQIAFQRHAFGVGDAGRTAMLVGILAGALVGTSATATAARTLFALGRRRVVFLISAGSVALYVVVAVALREAYGLDGIASAFGISATAAGLTVAVVLASALDIGPRRALREWLAVPLRLSGAFTAGALAVWLPFGGTHHSLGAAVGVAVAVGLAGLLTLGLGIRLSGGLEFLLLQRLVSRRRAARTGPAAP
jgi:peptidoglycan biosynthesis protein MviN/MurJ (putative lipid II flippase)